MSANMMAAAGDAYRLTVRDLRDFLRTGPIVEKERGKVETKRIDN